MLVKIMIDVEKAQKAFSSAKKAAMKAADLTKKAAKKAAKEFPIRVEVKKQ